MRRSGVVFLFIVALEFKSGNKSRVSEYDERLRFRLDDFDAEFCEFLALLLVQTSSWLRGDLCPRVPRPSRRCEHLWPTRQRDLAEHKPIVGVAAFARTICPKSASSTISHCLGSTAYCSAVVYWPACRKSGRAIRVTAQIRDGRSAS